MSFLVNVPSAGAVDFQGLNDLSTVSTDLWKTLLAVS